MNLFSNYVSLLKTIDFISVWQNIVLRMRPKKKMQIIGLKYSNENNIFVYSYYFWPYQMQTQSEDTRVN